MVGHHAGLPHLIKLEFVTAGSQRRIRRGMADVKIGAPHRVSHDE
jgi:hypothetical protein